jgi:hypothetical protein
VTPFSCLLLTQWFDLAVYMSKVKQQDTLTGNSDRQSERLRNEREVLRSFVDFFEGLKRALVATAKEGPRRHENMGAISQQLSRLSPLLNDQPAIAFMLDTVAASVEGMDEGLGLTGHVFEQVRICGLFVMSSFSHDFH